MSIQYKSSHRWYRDQSIWIWVSNTKVPTKDIGIYLDLSGYECPTQKLRSNFKKLSWQGNSHFVIPIFFATHVFKTTKSINLSFNLQRLLHPIENICGLYNLNLWQKLNSFHIIFQTLTYLNSEFKILKVYNITL